MPHIKVPDLTDVQEPSGRGTSSTGPPVPPAPGHRLGRSPRWLGRVGAEVILISLGVFLALMGDQWRENARNRELAQESLRRLQSEIQTNEEAVSAVREYHATTLASLQALLSPDEETREAASVRLEGVRPVFFENTAWDMALAIGSLVHIDPDVAFELSAIYDAQRRYDSLTVGFTNAMYMHPPSANDDAFFQALAVYYGDVVLMEPELLRHYAEVLPRIRSALEQ